MENYLITYKDIKDIIGQDEIVSFVTEKVREFISNHSEKDIKSFGSNLLYLIPIASDEIEKQDAKLLTRIVESVADYYVEKNRNEVRVSDSNLILYYPKFDVYYIRWYLMGSRNSVERLYSDDGAKVQKFIEDLVKREKIRDKQSITFIYDTPNGQQEETKKLNDILSDEQIFIEDKIKEEIYLSLETFFNEDRSFFKEYGIPFKRGILLYGPPGNGKTSIVKSVAAKTDHPVIYYQISEFTNSLTLQAVFNKAYDIAPVILVIEDIDGLPPMVRSSFLNILDGATSNEGIFLVGTTNYPERVDAALMNRAGRFDQTFEVKLPTDEMRLKYLLHTKLTNFLRAEDIELAAKMSKGFSVVQLKELYTNIVLKKRSGKEIDVKEIVQFMADNNRKKETGKWDKTEETIGFGF